MINKELIAKLQKFDPELDVAIPDRETGREGCICCCEWNSVYNVEVRDDEIHIIG